MAAKKKRAAKNSKQASTPAALYAAVFKLVEKEGWFRLTSPQIATAAGIRLSDLLQMYADKESLLIGFGRFIDQRLAEQVRQEDAPLKERLFDILMQRFELLQPYRGGIKRLMDDMVQDPLNGLCLSVALACPLHQAMQLVLELADVPANTMRAKLMASLLKLVYLKTLRMWKKDESLDLSQTMAALDRALARFMRFAQIGSAQ